MSFTAKIEADVAQWDKNLDKAGNKLDQFSKKTQKDLDNMSKAQRRSSGVAMEFNRIIQDAPFGMMGITNNLTQLTDNYKTYATQVREAAKEQGKAVSNMQIFKGAIGGILSPINLFSLGISAVTSGIILYQMWQQKSKNKTKEVTDETKKYIDELKNFVSTLDSVTQARLDGEKSANKEIITINSLKRVIENETVSRTARLSAINQLKQLYPGYFKNLSNEILLAGRAESAYKGLTRELINTAKARAAERKIAEEADKIIDITEKRFQRQKEQNKLQSENVKLLQAMNKEGLKPIDLTESQAKNVKMLQGFGNLLLKTNSEAEKAQIKQALNQTKINELKKQGITDSTEEIKATQAINRLQDGIVSNLTQGGLLVGNVGGELEKVKGTTKEIKDIMSDLVGSNMSEYDKRIFEIGLKYDKIFKEIKNIGDASRQKDAFGLATQAKEFELLNAQVDRYIDSTKSIVKDSKLNVVKELSLNYDKTSLQNSLTIPVELNPVLRSNVYTKGISTMTQKLMEDTAKLAEDISKEFSNILSSGIASGISNMFSTIGGALANGESVMQAIGDSLLSGLGELAKSMGEQMIAFGVAGLALKNLMMAPGLAIAAGAALVALGSIASSSVSRQTQKFDGNNAPSYSMPQDYLPRGSYYNDKQEVELKIRGNNLVGAYNINQNRNNRLG